MTVAILARPSNERDRAAPGPGRRQEAEPDDLHAIELPHNRPLSKRERWVDLGFLAFALAVAVLWAFRDLL